ncbi:MAG: imidazole glycerol phosphate synthase subunit HisH [Bacteroidaceae bacterium]|nr:imidazole glycerol phosphate synthase subunit HisH [Bacteroidaceae bacterium]
MNVAIVDYKAGNIYSVIHALERLGVSPLLTDNPELIAKADKVLFPGQGEAGNAMRYLKQHGLDRVIRELRQPLLGICIGQQLLCSHSEEGDVDCLGIFDVPVLRFRPQRHEDKVPHMGWNTIGQTRSPLFRGFEGNKFVYFVHSFYVPECEWTVATTDYIQPFSAALRRDNFYATQFHPEKSGDAGERILQNFLDL